MKYNLGEIPSEPWFSIAMQDLLWYQDLMAEDNVNRAIFSFSFHKLFETIIWDLFFNQLSMQAGFFRSPQSAVYTRVGEIQTLVCNLVL